MNMNLDFCPLYPQWLVPSLPISLSHLDSGGSENFTRSAAFWGTPDSLSGSLAVSKLVDRYDRQIPGILVEWSVSRQDCGIYLHSHYIGNRIIHQTLHIHSLTTTLIYQTIHSFIHLPTLNHQTNFFTQKPKPKTCNSHVSLLLLSSLSLRTSALLFPSARVDRLTLWAESKVLSQSARYAEFQTELLGNCF